MTPPNFSLLISPEELAQSLHSDGLLIVDMRNADNFGEGAIPGAVNIPYSSIVRGAAPAMGLLPTEAAVSEVLSEVGFSSDRHVVAYDDEGGGRASRLLWTLSALGHRGLSLLNGGLGAWTANGHGLGAQAQAPQRSEYKAGYANNSVVAEKNYILSRLGAADLALLDTRSPGEYFGADIRAARGGHIPGAVNLNWTDTMQPTRHLSLLPKAALQSMMNERGVTPDKEVIVYCQTHHRSAHTFIVLKHLGYERVRGYPGAWSDWGNDLNTPIAQINPQA